MLAPDEESSKKLGWIGNEPRTLAKLAWPIAVSMVSYAVMTTTDTLFVGRLGASALAGVGLAGITAFTLLAFCFGLLRAVKVLVSQARGAGKDAAAAAPIMAAGILFATLSGFAALLVGSWIADLLPRFADSVAAGEAASIYLRVRILAAPMVLIYVAYREACYGLGQTTAPMRASIMANVVNVGLDALFIFGFGWGGRGAALASVAATAVEVLAIMRVGPRVELADFVRGLRWIRRLLAVGAPTGLQFLIELGSFAALSFMISALAEVEMAAHQIAIQVIHFSFLPAVAIGEGASIMAGEAVGANRDDLVSPIGRVAMKICGLYMALCTVVLAVLAPQIASAFTSDPGVIARATILLYLAAAFQLGDGANIVARCVLRGTGDVRFPAIVGITMAWLLIPPSCWFFGYHLGMGAVGGWLGLTAEIMAGAGVFWWRLERGGWKTAARKSRAEIDKTA